MTVSLSFPPPKKQAIFPEHPRALMFGTIEDTVIESSVWRKKATQRKSCLHDAETGKENAGDARRRTESTTVVGRMFAEWCLVSIATIDVTVERGLNTGLSCKDARIKSWVVRIYMRNESDRAR